MSNGGTNSGVDPDPLSAAMATTPPAPGTAAPSTIAARQPAVQVTQASGSGFGTVVAFVLAVVAIVVVIAFLVNSADDSGSLGTDAPDTPATTQPAEPPAEE